MLKLVMAIVGLLFSVILLKKCEKTEEKDAGPAASIFTGITDRMREAGSHCEWYSRITDRKQLYGVYLWQLWEPDVEDVRKENQYYRE